MDSFRGQVTMGRTSARMQVPPSGLLGFLLQAGSPDERGCRDSTLLVSGKREGELVVRSLMWAFGEADMLQE